MRLPQTIRVRSTSLLKVAEVSGNFIHYAVSWGPPMMSTQRDSHYGGRRCPSIDVSISWSAFEETMLDVHGAHVELVQARLAILELKCEWFLTSRRRF
jgi:hypothetical protein